MARAIIGLTAGLLAAGWIALAPGMASAADSVAWRHGVLEAKSDAGIIFMASKGGFAAKQGLAVEIMQMRDDPISLKALLSGEVETIEGSPGATLIAGSRGADIKILGCYWPALPHGVFVQDTIDSVADLKGKTIAIAGPSGVPDLVIRAMLQKYDVPIGDVSLANLGSDLDRYKAVAAGVAAATVVSMEYVPIAAKSHLKLLLAARDVMPDYVRICIMTTGKMLSERRADAVKFVTAEMQGLAFALGHRDETLALTRDISHIAADDPRPAFLYDDVVKNRSVDPDMPIPLDKLDWLQHQLVSMGNISAPYDLTRIVEPEVRKEALKSVGK
jgi:NitT/TauT family transport system substrate-binding protein